MKLDRKFAARRFRRTHSYSQGYTNVEMLATVGVLLILIAFASPMLLRVVRIYQLNNSATQLAGMVKLTRFEAIRKNTKVDCRFQPNGATWLVWSALPSGNASTQQTQLILGGYANMLPGGAPVPDPTPIANSVGGGGALNPVSGNAGLIRFDSRGAVDYQGGPLSVLVFYLGSADATPGYRAVLVMPAGTTQIWSTSSTGVWQRTS